MDDRINEIEREQTRIEGVVEAMPAAGEFHSLTNSVAETRGDVRAIRASLGGIEKMVTGLGGQVTSINNYLLEKRT